ncbi:hypothetical protein KOR34_13480 [Posidoniimonas corsicana]|uniref:Uncharacterized protein n=1 Tax=Posidoniimonas corsicana TaxID=1938618 RepID=A0A5C5VEJ6_9BACT|nr:hypothetical protein [Posidoniimonas corsicana]TWT36443.1 hypothetical protein KOR34_13480 [Posidoniimonas corsicana]
MNPAPSRCVPLAAAALLILATPLLAAETRVLLDGLRAPVALAASPNPAGGVLIAERDPAAVKLWSATGGDRVVVPAPPDELAAGESTPMAVAYLSEQAFVVAWSSVELQRPAVALYALQSTGAAKLSSVRRLDEEEAAVAAPMRSLSRGARFLYAVAGENPTLMLKARHNSGLLSRFRTAAELSGAINALCESPQGYLTAASGGAVEFFESDPTAGQPLARYETGLERIWAVTYGSQPRPYARLLYVIGSAQGEEPAEGLYRIDAAVDASGRPAAKATPIVQAPGLLAVAFGAEGEALLLQAGESGGGRLLRVVQEL